MKKFNLKKTVALAAIATVGFTLNVNGQTPYWNPGVTPAVNAVDIWHDGKVGCGTGAAPTTYQLEVHTSIPNNGIMIDQTSGGDISLFLQNTAGTGDFWSINHNSSGDFYLYENAASLTRLFIENTTGNVGIGTGLTSPTAKLDVLDNVAATNVYAIHGLADAGTTDNYGIYGETGTTPGSNINAGVYGKIGSNINPSAINAAIYGDVNSLSGTSDWAGYFVGNVMITAQPIAPVVHGLVQISV